MTAEIDLRGRVVFLVGARRSGTNWLHNLMAVHPRIARVPSETHLIYTLAELQGRFQHGLLGSANTGTTYLPRKDLIDSFRQLCDKAFAIQLGAAQRTDLLLVERTPLHTQHLDLIAEIYPDSPVVHLIRDPREVATSLVRQPWGPDSVEEAAQEWVDTVGRARAHRSPRYVEVRYEDLVADVVTAMSGVFGFLGLDTSDAIAAQLRAVADQPINRSPEPSRRPLAADEQADIEAVAGVLMKEVGYQPAGRASDEIPARRRHRAVGSRRRGTVREEVGEGKPTELLLDHVQFIVDRFLGGIAVRDVRAVKDLMSPTATVQLRDEGTVLSAAPDRSQAAQALIDAAAPEGTQIRGDSFGGRPTFTVVWSHDDDGHISHRLFVIAVASDGLVSSVDYYRMR
ncbi:MAG: sulfotransferase [Frankiaceae bacterium]|nr:sulfotransferase [Frankiaceae bacterium]MBV9871491.1 sulfotransferase [Frankiaceae bacterium]